MAGTKTPNFELYKPLLGERLWNALINANFDTIDTALAAHAVILAAKANTSDMTTALAAKAALSHTHAQSEITDLVSALAGKAAASHTHTISQISDVTNQIVVPSPNTLKTASGNSNSMSTLISVASVTIPTSVRGVVDVTVSGDTPAPGSGYAIYYGIALYKNGVLIGTAVTGTQNGGTSIAIGYTTNDMRIVAGDVLAVYAYCNSDQSAIRSMPVSVSVKGSIVVCGPTQAW